MVEEDNDFKEGGFFDWSFNAKKNASPFAKIMNKTPFGEFLNLTSGKCSKSNGFDFGPFDNALLLLLLLELLDAIEKDQKKKKNCRIQMFVFHFLSEIF